MQQQHWDRVYTTKDVQQVSWYEPVPSVSLELIGRVAAPTAAVLDVGAGASLLVDHLLARGHTDVSLLDISAVALGLTRGRLPTDAPVEYHVGDVRRWQPPRHYDVWHDRAVFHFLTDAEDRAAYRRVLLAGLASGGHVVAHAFHIGGPDRCSDLPTARYDADGLHQALGGPEHFTMLEARTVLHPHPRGGTQTFQVVLLRRRG